MMDKVMQNTVAEFLRTLLQDKWSSFLDGDCEEEVESHDPQDLEKRVAEAMEVWCEMTHKPRGLTFLSYPFSMYASDEEEKPEKKRKVSAYNHFFSQTFHNIRKENPDMRFGQINTVISTLWKKLTKEEKLTYKPSDTTTTTTPPTPTPVAAVAAVAASTEEENEMEMNSTQIDSTLSSQPEGSQFQYEVSSEDEDDSEEADGGGNVGEDSDQEEDEDQTQPMKRVVMIRRDFSQKENQKQLSKNEKSLWKELTKMSKKELLDRLDRNGLESRGFMAPEESRSSTKMIEKAEKTYLANIVMNSQFEVSTLTTTPPIVDCDDNVTEDLTSTFSLPFSTNNRITEITTPTATASKTTMIMSMGSTEEILRHDNAVEDWNDVDLEGEEERLDRMYDLYPERRIVVPIGVIYTDPKVYLFLDKDKKRVFMNLLPKKATLLYSILRKRNIEIPFDLKDYEYDFETSDSYKNLMYHNVCLNILMNLYFPSTSTSSLPVVVVEKERNQYPPPLPVRYVGFEEDLIHICRYDPNASTDMTYFYEMHRELRLSHLEHILHEHRIFYPVFTLPTWAKKHQHAELHREYLLHILMNTKEWELFDYERLISYHRKLYYYIGWDEKDNGGKPCEPRCKCSSADLTTWDPIKDSSRESTRRV